MKPMKTMKFASFKTTEEFEQWQVKADVGIYNIFPIEFKENHVSGGSTITHGIQVMYSYLTPVKTGTDNEEKTNVNAESSESKD